MQFEYFNLRKEINSSMIMWLIKNLSCITHFQFLIYLKREEILKITEISV